MPVNVNEVEGLALSQEDRPQTQFTMENCATDWHIFGFRQHNHQYSSALDVPNISSNI